MILKKIKKYWDGDQPRELTKFSVVMTLICIAPYFLMMLIFNGFENPEQVPTVLGFVVQAFSTITACAFGVFALTGIYAMMAKRKLENNTFFVGLVSLLIVLFIITR
ncbi:hypothetical protein [Bacillus horti]|uniref:Uncharacterized membrane protein (DUF485 family) n=1 Tax=Caldalkalibacillus horti TaxID=77523 RepID=A0ABT9VW77_9BACI|nr:hypothetical protein [Bacillus horti]MDQ0165222.1 uncharacterized membrane protein (DUF485 family) [Bacillus horti]